MEREMCVSIACVCIHMYVYIYIYIERERCLCMIYMYSRLFATSWRLRTGHSSRRRGCSMRLARAI